MKKATLLSLSFIVFNLAFAQHSKDDMHGNKSKNRVENFEKVSKELNLTEDQQSKMKSINQETKKKMEDLDKQQALTVKQYNDKKTAIRKEAMSKREAILTKEQKDKLSSIKSERESKMKEFSTKRLENMKKNLSLTDDQEKKINALQDKMSAELSVIRKDDKLNDQEKKSKINKIREDFRSSTGNILTEEQKNKLEELRKNKSGKS